MLVQVEKDLFSRKDPSVYTSRTLMAENPRSLTLRRGAARVRNLLAQRAREDPNVFCRFVLRDERTSKRIVQAPVHQRWHKLLNEHSRVIFIAHVEGGKTAQLAVGRVLWELGRDPSLRVAIISNTKDMAMKIVRLLGQYIQKSEELHMVFPELLPTDDPALPWKSMALTVRRVGVGGKDPSVQACGVHGNILGSRVDLLIFDDVLDHENTATPAPREDVYRWIRSTPMSRLTENARVWGIGNAWHPDDAMHRLAKEPRFHAFRFPVIDERGNLTWPERWPIERIRGAKEDLGPLEYARQLMCQARDDTSARFKREWIDRCLKEGEGYRICHNIEDAWIQGAPDAAVVAAAEEGDEYDPTAARAAHRIGGPSALKPEWLARAHVDIWLAGEGAFVFTGVDLGVQRRDANDLTALFTLMRDTDGFRRVLRIDSGRWTGPEIIEHIEWTYERFGSIFIVENNAAQNYIIDFTAKSSLSIPVIPFTTGRNKAHPEFGIESIGAEMAAGRWRIPNQGGRVDEEVGEWITELLFYDPREHVGDRVMASWFAREGIRRYADFGGRGQSRVSVRSF